MLVQLINHLLSLRNIRMLQFNYLFLHGLAHISQDNIIMALVIRYTQLTIEGFIDSAAVFYLCVFVLLAEEFSRVVRKIVQFIKGILSLFLLLRSRLKFLESIHRILNFTFISSGLKSLCEICLN